MTPGPRAVWLVGLSGSGKSTVGPLVARRLGWAFVDLDAEITARAGAPVPDIFRDGGEERFRRLEADVATRLAGRREVVVAAGGGWMARRDLDRRVCEGVRVWLRVAPRTAATRLAAGDEPRPLLSAGGVAESLARMLVDRKAAYGEAEVAVDTEGRDPHEVAEVVLERLRRLGVPEGEPTGGPRTT